MKSHKIVGVFLVRNEDRFIRRSMENVVESCDEVLVFDHGSNDGTPEILKEFQKRFDHVKVNEIRDPKESHDALISYVGTNTWIFAVDGDEIYDGERTRLFLNQLREGEHSEHFRIRGNTLHCTEGECGRFTGYLSPPARSVVKLYNFGVVKEWNDGYERLHGGKLVLKNGLLPKDAYELSRGFEFADSPLRCLHLPFTRRSSKDPEHFVPRQNIPDRICRRRLARMYFDLRNWLRIPVPSEGKQKNYACGERVTLELEGFGINGVQNCGELR
ncbi:MAG: glycosyltransferase family 2 protein [Puniceicoccales bacterium]